MTSQLLPDPSWFPPAPQASCSLSHHSLHPGVVRPLAESLAPSGALDLHGQGRGWGRETWGPSSLTFLDFLALPGASLSDRSPRREKSTGRLVRSLTLTNGELSTGEARGWRAVCVRRPPGTMRRQVGRPEGLIVALIFFLIVCQKELQKCHYRDSLRRTLLSRLNDQACTTRLLHVCGGSGTQG